MYGIAATTATLSAMVTTEHQRCYDRMATLLCGRRLQTASAWHCHSIQHSRCQFLGCQAFDFKFRAQYQTVA